MVFVMGEKKPNKDRFRQRDGRGKPQAWSGQPERRHASRSRSMPYADFDRGFGAFVLVFDKKLVGQIF
jgi:hypothetical protein